MTSAATVCFDFREHGVLTRSDISGRTPLPDQRYFLNDNAISAGLSANVDQRFADWLEIAHAVYLADRLVRRPWSHERDPLANWARSILLKIPVRDFTFWSSEKVGSLLTEILGFVTEDEWQFEFSPQQRRTEKQQYLFQSVSGPVEVALLSAGLDSFAGGLIRQSELPNTHFVFVSAATNDKLRGRQSEQFCYIRANAPSHATHICLEHHLLAPPSRVNLESSQRSRGFLHLTLGCIVALTVGARRLHIYENGVGAINLPLDGSQIGAFNSRPVNPCTLVMMSRLASLVGERHGFHILNPFLFSTKGKMCSAPSVLRASAMLRRTISCDRPPRETGRDHCGTCSSCILRRISLFAAGLHNADPRKGYVFDIFSSPPPSSSRRRWLAMEKMQWQVGTLERALNAAAPWDALSQEFWMLPRVASTLRLSEEGCNAEAALVALYREYIAEWRELASLGVQRIETWAA